MTKITRRAAVATVALGSLTTGVRPLVAAASDEPEGAPKKLHALAPHWLDEVIGNSTDPTEIAGRLARNKKLIELVAKAVKDAQDHPTKPGLVGPTYPQRVRVKLLTELCPARPQADGSKGG